MAPDCDFEEGDRPPPHKPTDDCSYGPDTSLPKEIIPPLVQAVKLGDVSLVQLLLSNRANLNAGYYNLCKGPIVKSIKFMYSRVIWLAIELERYETIKLLLTAGADIGLAQPI